MRRREFLGLVGGAAAWPVVGRAQQSGPMRRVGVFITGSPTDSETMARLAAFQKGMQTLGWSEGVNVRFDYRFGTEDDELRAKAKELVALAPEVIFAATPPTVMALLRIERSVPVVFAAVTDPVGLGIVQSLAHPGGNATGFLSAEFSFGGKWVELLSEIAPGTRRVGVLTNPENRGSPGQFATIQTAASAKNIESVLLGFHDPAEIERTIVAFARIPNSGLIALRIVETITNRELIAKLATEYRLPTVYPLKTFATSGGLVSYGPDIVFQFREAAGYVARILNGEKPAELPVQTPTKYELTINLKAAKAIGLTVPPTLLARADEVIE
jgi:putative tryptophan/tyrosine transport system substrate-binding protein